MESLTAATRKTNAPADGPRPAIGHDLRDWLDIARQLDQLEAFEGAAWDLEIGTITELVALQSARPRCLLFDNIPGYPAGYRVVTNSFTSKGLSARLMGIPEGQSLADMTNTWRAKTKDLQLIPPREVTNGPLFENVFHGAAVDLEKFPTPRWHEGDGGRYLGTACLLVSKDPENGQINVGCYRMMLHGRDKVGLYISPGKHSRVHRDKYFAAGRPMPVAAAFGMHHLLHVAASLSIPQHVNEYDWAGGVRGQPEEVALGPVTGLPLPASAEIAIEGYVYPDRRLPEGPFGEWTGYYASAVRDEPYVQVEALYHRHDPIILGTPPMRPPSGNYYVRYTILHGLIWDALEAAGITDVRGITFLPAAGTGMLVISIQNRYEGHARQAAHIAAQCRAGAYLGRYIVVLDDDIDPENVDEVLWAIWSRSDPEESLDLVRHCWSTPLDPRIPPERRALGDFGTSRLIIDATRPYHWRGKFPAVSMASLELQAQTRSKWGAKVL